MTAQEAFDLAKDKEFDTVMYKIIKAASNGEIYIMVNQISPDTRTKLKDLGYLVLVQHVNEQLFTWYIGWSK